MYTMRFWEAAALPPEKQRRSHAVEEGYQKYNAPIIKRVIQGVASYASFQNTRRYTQKHVKDIFRIKRFFFRRFYLLSSSLEKDDKETCVSASY